jgi:hypothetical protein
MAQYKINPREKYRQRENIRINASSNIAEKFRELKALDVDLLYFDAGGIRKTSEIKYSVNLANAKSAFSFRCSNDQCVSGDFDLSEALALAVAARRTTATGEISCQGWQSKTTIDTTHCCNLLRYTLKLRY